MAATQFLQGKRRNAEILLFCPQWLYMPKEKRKSCKRVTEYWNLVYFYLLWFAFSLTQNKKSSFTFNIENYVTRGFQLSVEFRLFSGNIMINKSLGFTEIMLLLFMYSVICYIRNISRWMLLLIAISKKLFLYVMFNNKSFDWVCCSLFSEWLSNALLVCRLKWKCKQH